MKLLGLAEAESAKTLKKDNPQTREYVAPTSTVGINLFQVHEV